MTSCTILFLDKENNRRKYFILCTLCTVLGKNKSLSEADSPSRQISVRANVSSDVATSRTRRDKPRGNMSLKWRTVYRRTVNEGLKLPLVVGRRNETIRGIMELDYDRKASTPLWCIGGVGKKWHAERIVSASHHDACGRNIKGQECRNVYASSVCSVCFRTIRKTLSEEFLLDWFFLCCIERFIRVNLFVISYMTIIEYRMLQYL